MSTTPWGLGRQHMPLGDTDTRDTEVPHPAAGVTPRQAPSWCPVTSHRHLFCLE